MFPQILRNQFAQHKWKKKKKKKIKIKIKKAKSKIPETQMSFTISPPLKLILTGLAEKQLIDPRLIIRLLWF